MFINFIKQVGGESEHPQLYKQLHYPVNYNGHLDFYALQRFFRGADHSYLHTINLVGDVFSYPYKAELMDMLYSMSAKKHFYLTEAYAAQFMEEIKALDLKNYELHIYCEGVGKPDGIHQELKARNIPFQWVYLLSDEAQTEELEQLETLYGEENIEVRPVFTGENFDFFENSITRMPDKQPPLLKVMDGTAEIIVREESLLERLLLF